MIKTDESILSSSTKKRCSPPNKKTKSFYLELNLFANGEVMVVNADRRSGDICEREKEIMKNISDEF